MRTNPARNISRANLKANHLACVRGLLFLSYLIFGISFSVGHLRAGKIGLAASRKAQLPFYVYGDESGKLSQFAPSGYMGDVNSLSALTSATDESAPASTGRAGHTSLKVRYSAKGKSGWAAIYWLSPANNWGTLKGAGFDLQKSKKLTFWLRGEKGGEKISQVKVGGVNGPYPDSDAIWMGPLTLTKEWKQFSMDLEGKDLHHIIGGFMFLVRKPDNPTGATFYMDEVVFRGSPKDEVESNAIAEAQNENDSMASAQAAAASGASAAAHSARQESGESDVRQVVYVPSAGPKYIPDPAGIPIPARWLKYRKGVSHAE